MEALQGSRVVVELKRDMIVRGTLESVDDGMGLTLSQVAFEDLQKNVTRLDLMHVRGKSIRYVHLPSKTEPDHTILSHRRRIVKERKLMELQAIQSAPAPH